MNAVSAVPASALSAILWSLSAQHQLAPGLGRMGRGEKDPVGTDQLGAAAASRRALFVEKALEIDAGLLRTFVVLVVVVGLIVIFVGVRSMQAIVALTFLALVLTIIV